MGDTKKVGSTGRFGARYGVGIRKKLLKVEPKQYAEKKCPACGSNRVNRRSKGIFRCTKCAHEFVGGAYLPKTLTGGLIAQMVSQKKFSAQATEALAEEVKSQKANKAEKIATKTKEKRAKRENRHQSAQEPEKENTEEE
ncbi:MAG: 50S ribosomal protein L37ae [archaeon]|nr:50S ribosomal protein L37ae [archaeon]